jgi:hypothetical protein
VREADADETPFCPATIVDDARLHNIRTATPKPIH